MKKMMQILAVILISIGLQGCYKQEEKIVLPPTMSVGEVAKAYMEAMKTQNGIEMANYAKNGLGDDFRIREIDVTELGLSVEAAQTFCDHLLNFDYELSKEVVSEDLQTANMDVLVKAYDIQEVLDKGVAKNKKEFEKISKTKETDIEKNKQITDILLNQFNDALKTYEQAYTLKFTLVENEWKIDAVGDEFYNILLNTSLETGE